MTTWCARDWISCTLEQLFDIEITHIAQGDRACNILRICIGLVSNGDYKLGQAGCGDWGKSQFIKYEAD